MLGSLEPLTWRDFSNRPESEKEILKDCLLGLLFSNLGVATQPDRQGDQDSLLEISLLTRKQQLREFVLVEDQVSAILRRYLLGETSHHARGVREKKMER